MQQIGLHAPPMQHTPAAPRMRIAHKWMACNCIVPIKVRTREVLSLCCCCCNAHRCNNETNIQILTRFFNYFSTENNAPITAKNGVKPRGSTLLSLPLHCARPIHIGRRDRLQSLLVRLLPWQVITYFFTKNGALHYEHGTNSRASG